jgi:hypothetical protein
MKNMPAIAGIMKKRICQGDWTHCARHTIFEKLGAEAVPLDLFPDEIDKAQHILVSNVG